jgi:hypothetical protein
LAVSAKVGAVFECSYRLVDCGCSETRVADEAAEVVVPAWHVSDALGGLLEAVALITEGVGSAQCFFLDDQGEHRWLFERRDATVDVRIVAFDQPWSDQPNEMGRLVFETRQPVLRVARAVLSTAQQVLDELGDELYAERSRRAFPTEALARLRRAIRSARARDAG